MDSKKTAERAKKPVVNSSGSRIKTAIQLKKSCTVAPAKALWNSSRRVTWASETRVLVTDVPMFAPMTMGMAPSMVSAPAATRATIMDVVVDELWTCVVASKPTKSPTNGLEVRSMSASAKPLPKSLKDRPIMSRPTKNPNNRVHSRISRSTNHERPGRDTSAVTRRLPAAPRGIRQAYSGGAMTSSAVT